MVQFSKKKKKNIKKIDKVSDPSYLLKDEASH